MAISKTRIALIAVLAIMLLGLAVLYFFWNPSQHHLFPKCPLYAMTGIYCPGCGSQRAVHQMVHGNILEGIRHNYLMALLFVVLIYQALLYVLQWAFAKTYFNLLHHAWTIKIILFLILLFWVARNIPYYPFTELVP